jgi:hypothetical protein
MRFTPKVSNKRAEAGEHSEQGGWEGYDQRARASRQHPVRRFTAAGERVRPLAKGYRRSSCEWVTGIGWVWNPTHRSYS